MMSQRVYLKEEIHRPVGDLVKEQIVEWQSALVRIISFTEAKSPAGAMVQMALALDEMDSMIELLDEENQKLVGHHRNQIDRLIKSAMRGVRAPLGAEFESVEAIVNVYASGLYYWLDEMETWAKEGRAYRKSESDRSPQG
jgi:hypothetical protein